MFLCNRGQTSCFYRPGNLLSLHPSPGFILSRRQRATVNKNTSSSQPNRLFLHSGWDSPRVSAHTPVYLGAVRFMLSWRWTVLCAKMPVRRGHVALQNTYLDTIIRKFDEQSESGVLSSSCQQKYIKTITRAAQLLIILSLLNPKYCVNSYFNIVFFTFQLILAFSSLAYAKELNAKNASFSLFSKCLIKFM